MAHDDHFHCYDHGGSTAVVTRTDTHLRGKTGKPDISFYSLKKDLNDLAARSGGLLSVSKLGTTPGRFGGRDILLARLGKDFGTTKPKTLLTAGLHAREWIGPSYVYLVAEWLIDNQSNFIARKILDECHVLFVPMVNPDGHEYSVTTARLFRKNSPAGDNDFQNSPTANPIGQRPGAPESVDLNRNFDSPNRQAILKSRVGHFSTEPNDDEFAGTGPAFETLVMQKLIKKEKVDALVDHHSFGCFCLHSPGDDVRALAAIDPAAGARYQVFTPEITRLLNQRAAGNLTTRTTPDKWISSQASDFYRRLNVIHGLAPMSPKASLVPGGIDDFAFYNSVPPSGMRALGYTLELPPTSGEKKIGFKLPEADIRPVFRMCLGATLAFITLCAEPNPNAAQFGAFNLAL